MAKVSIILPIFNVQDYLRECLDSVTGQTLEDIEIICVNDGSTDSSLDIINEYAQKDKRIVVITGPNGGYGKAMNKGLDKASGEYIGIVEPDDYVEKDMFEKLYLVASENQLDFVKSDFYRFTRETGKEINNRWNIDETEKRYGELLNPSQDPTTIRFTMNTWTGIYRREYINNNHIRHNETSGASFQDNGFYFQTFMHAKRAMIVHDAYYHNRRDNPNSSVKNKEKVYCMSVELDFVRKLMQKDPEIWNRFKYMYWWKKYHNYNFTYERIDDKFKKEYMERMRAEFKRALQQDELDPMVFTPFEWKQIESMLKGSKSIVEKVYSLKIVKMILPHVPQSVKNQLFNIIARRKK